MSEIRMLVAACVALLWAGTVTGQETTVHHQHPTTEETADSMAVKSVKELFTKGNFEGHVRHYFMGTANYRSLSDHYANAIGAEVGYKTAPFHGFSVGLAGLFTYNVWSSNLHHLDPVSQKHPKLELELFDVEDPENKTDLDRLDALYLEYASAKLQARIGRFSFNSPLMNPQDTRMKPYSFQGVQVQVPVTGMGEISLAWLNHFSPRSTVAWFKAGESIGIFSKGVDEFGNPSGYPGVVETKGVAVIGLKSPSHKLVQAELWNYWVENIANTAYAKAVVQVHPKVEAGLEGLVQTQLGEGGNPDPGQAYFPDQQQWLAGAMLAYKPAGWRFSANFLHIGENARFLFPREWGREQFFATIPRGRMEGTGNADLLVLKALRKWSNHFSTEAAAARSWIPDPTDYRHNKYGSLAYWGWMTDLRYVPKKQLLDGLSFRLLYVGRVSPQASVALKDYYYNSNFHHVNLITQITF